MALRITLGEYCAADSPLHALDPRAKAVGALALTASAFFVRTPPALAVAWGMAGALAALSRVPVPRLLGSLRPVALVLAPLAVLNLALVREGEALLAAGPLVITTGGLWAAALYPLRLLAATVVAALLLLTTTPTRLTDAFDALLSPLARLGLPAHELAMVLSLMLRFIPTLADEAGAIVDAQTARGGALAEGGPIRRVRAVTPVVVALLASALRHANDLARALDARCYEGGRGRSHWHPLRMRARDWLALALVAAYLAVLALLP